MPRYVVINSVNNATFTLNFEIFGLVMMIDLYTSIPTKGREKTTLSEVLLNMLISFFFLFLIPVIFQLICIRTSMLTK